MASAFISNLALSSFKGRQLLEYICIIAWRVTHICLVMLSLQCGGHNKEYVGGCFSM